MLTNKASNDMFKVRNKNITSECEFTQNERKRQQNRVKFRCFLC